MLFYAILALLGVVGAAWGNPLQMQPFYALRAPPSFQDGLSNFLQNQNFLPIEINVPELFQFLWRILQALGMQIGQVIQGIPGIPAFPGIFPAGGVPLTLRLVPLAVGRPQEAVPLGHVEAINQDLQIGGLQPLLPF